MRTLIPIVVNGAPRQVAAESTVAAALLQLGVHHMRTSVSGEPRGPVCGMGVCYDCRVTIDGRPHQRGCLVVCRPGMHVETDDADG
jgi:hypothetical protein